MRHWAPALALASWLLAACASGPGGPASAIGPADLAGALAGRWSNAAQFAAAPEALKRAPAAGHPYDWLDQQDARFAPVSAPLIGGSVVYLEWRNGAGAISRQRLWAFSKGEDGGLTMAFFTFKAPEAFAGAAERPQDFAAAFAALTPADLIGYPASCALAVEARGASAWSARIDSATCRIVARSGRTMGIDADVRLEGETLSYAEAGVLEDGTFAFKVPGGPPYAFRRIP